MARAARPTSAAYSRRRPTIVTIEPNGKDLSTKGGSRDRSDAIAREELTRAGLDRDIWQMPVVLLADVRSVGVQGDGRTYGHPVVLRPVTSEDAMTADWARLPYDVLEGLKLPIDARCNSGGLRGLAIGAFEVCADRGSRFVGSMLPAPVFDDLLRARRDQYLADRIADAQLVILPEAASDAIGRHSDACYEGPPRAESHRRS